LDEAFPPFDAAFCFAARDAALEAGPRREEPAFLVDEPFAEACPPLEAAFCFAARDAALEAGPLRDVFFVVEVVLEAMALLVPPAFFAPPALAVPPAFFVPAAFVVPPAFFVPPALLPPDFDAPPALAVVAFLAPPDFVPPILAAVAFLAPDLEPPILPAVDFCPPPPFDVDFDPALLPPVLLAAPPDFFVALDLLPIPSASPENISAIFSRRPCDSLAPLPDFCVDFEPADLLEPDLLNPDFDDVDDFLVEPVLALEVLLAEEDFCVLPADFLPEFLPGLGLLGVEQLQSAAPACINLSFLGSMFTLLLYQMVPYGYRTGAWTTTDICGSRSP
jgi:hypothetical protein